MYHPHSPTLGCLHEATLTSQQLSRQLRPPINMGACRWEAYTGCLEKASSPVSYQSSLWQTSRCPQFYFALWSWFSSFQFSMCLVLSYRVLWIQKIICILFSLDIIRQWPFSSMNYLPRIFPVWCEQTLSETGPTFCLHNFDLQLHEEKSLKAPREVKHSGYSNEGI